MSPYNEIQVMKSWGGAWRLQSAKRRHGKSPSARCGRGPAGPAFAIGYGTASCRRSPGKCERRAFEGPAFALDLVVNRFTQPDQAAAAKETEGGGREAGRPNFERKS